MNVRMPTEKAHGYQIAKMCEALALGGAEVSLLVPTRRNDTEKDIFSYYGVRGNFRVEYVPTFDAIAFLRGARIGFYLQAISFLWAIRSVDIPKNNIIITRNPEIVWWYGRSGYKVFYDAHNFPRRGVWFLKKLLSRISGVIANSNGTADAFHCIGFSNILTAPNAVDLTQFTNTEIQERGALGLPPGRIAMYVGHLYEWKGVSVVVDAACQTVEKNLTFVFLGGTDKDLVVYREKTKDLKNVLFLGHHPRNRIPAFIKSADVLLLPNIPTTEESVSYTSPIKMFEYMASGVPIVASDLPSIREVLNDKNSILVKAGDPGSLLLGIESSFGYEAQEKALVAKEQVKEYTWDARAMRVVSFLDAHSSLKDTEFYNKESEYYSKKRYPLIATDFNHFFFKKRLSILFKYLKFINNKYSDLLEIGCADGVIISSIYNKGLASGKISGIDISEKMIEVAKKNVKAKNVSFYVRGEEPDYVFDIIIEIGVINFTDFDEEVRYVMKNLKPSGLYIASISATSSLQNMLKPQNALSYQHIDSYKKYEDKWKKTFEIIDVKPYGLFIPLLWRAPRVARILQPAIEAVFSRLTPHLFHERIYLLKKKSS